jgi:hypothetical protein
MIGHAAAADCVVLGDLGYVLPVDPPYDLRSHGLFVTVDLTEASGTFTEIGLFSLEDLVTPERSAPEYAELPNGMTVYYSLGLSEPKGSAGPIADLTGWLDADVPLGVSCWTRQEIPNPEWCLPILGQLRPEAEGCAAGEN